MPSVDEGLSGKATINNDAFSIEGMVKVQGEEWRGSASFGFTEMEMIGIPPEGYLAEFEQYATSLIDEKFSEAEALREQLEEATRNYEIELSLRGLRSVLPGILRNTLTIIEEQVDLALAEARRKIREELADRDRKLRRDNLTTVVGNLVRPYKNTINHLITVLETEDSETVRIELERLLRELASMRSINASVTFTITHYGFFLGIPTPDRTDSRTTSVNINVLNDDQVNKLLQAADYG